MDAKTLCLAVLSLGDASPYEIRGKVEDVFARFMEVAPSSIYAAVKALEQEGLIAGTFHAQEGRPNKTVYRLLEPGRRRLARSLGALEGRHRVRSELVALLMFAHLLPPEKLRDALGQREAELDALAVELEGHAAPSEPGQRFALAMGRNLVAAERAFLKESVPAFLAELEARLPIPAPATAHPGRA
ncbi:PadR family transcriptional regulator [Aestuariivirga sp.]|uniref:PadR family transcriptional regulator n=1 Tax=Aestuariivirga sp. TaxID=2650926 RepID=UPI00391BCD96